MKNIAVLFPGQGSQYKGMGKKLYENYSVAREVFEEAGDVLNSDIKKICFEGGREALAKTENTQPAVLTVGIAAFKVLLNETGVKPKCLAGHSLGEISALVGANGIKFSDAVKLVKLRSEYMQEAVPVSLGLMLAVKGIDAEFVREECSRISQMDNVAVVSNYNSPLQTVVSGNKKAVETVGKRLQEKGARVVPLDVSAPFHSPLMRPAAEKLREHLSSLSYNKLKYPVLSNVTAFPYIDENNIPAMLASQITQPVRWVSSMKFLYQEEIDTVIDIGPNDVLKRLMKENYADIMAFSFDKDKEVIHNLIGAYRVENTPMYDQMKKIEFIERCMAIAVCTPNNNSGDEYQREFVELYKSVKRLLLRLKAYNVEPEVEHMKQAVEMLRSSFLAKKTPQEEQKNRLERLFKGTDSMNLFSNDTPSVND